MDIIKSVIKNVGECMKKIALFIFAALSLLFVSCNKEERKGLLDKIKEKGELVIATEGLWPPFSFHNDSGDLIGYDIEVAKNVCQRIGVAPRFVEVEWERILPGIESGIYDIAFNGVNIREERKEKFYFSKPYAIEHTVLITHKDNYEIKSFEDLKGKSCANALNSYYQSLAKKYDASLIIIDSLEEEMDLVSQGRAEATINADVSFYEYLATHPAAPLKIVDSVEDAHKIGAPCLKDEKNLPFIQAVDAALDEMRQDGTLVKISSKYFGKDLSE